MGTVNSSPPLGCQGRPTEHEVDTAKEYGEMKPKEFVTGVEVSMVCVWVGVWVWCGVVSVYGWAAGCGVVWCVCVCVCVCVGVWVGVCGRCVCVWVGWFEWVGAGTFNVHLCLLCTHVCILIV